MTRVDSAVVPLGDSGALSSEETMDTVPRSVSWGRQPG